MKRRLKKRPLGVCLHLLMWIPGILALGGCSSDGFFRNREMDYMRVPVKLSPAPQTPEGLPSPDLIPAYPIPVGVNEYPVGKLPSMSPDQMQVVGMDLNAENATPAPSINAIPPLNSPVKSHLGINHDQVPYLNVYASPQALMATFQRHLHQAPLVPLIKPSVDLQHQFVFFQMNVLAPVQLIQVIGVEHHSILVLYTADGQPDDSHQATQVLEQLQGFLNHL